VIEIKDCQDIEKIREIEKREGTTFVPDSITEDMDIAHIDLSVWMMISLISKEKNRKPVSRAEVQERMRYSRLSIFRSIKRLEKKNYITKISFPGKEAFYEARIPINNEEELVFDEIKALKNMANRPKNYVYFIKNESGKMVKIGYSKNPEKRLKMLERTLPMSLELVYFMPGSELREKRLHEKFSKYRIKGEWFIFSDEIKQYIEKVKDHISYPHHPR
jgi:Fe2+ or Zn2+ uptake regulation protein